MKIQCLVLWLLPTLCLATSAANTSEEVSDCEVRFEDTHACACTNSSNIPEVSCHHNTVIIQPCYCIYYDLDMNMTLIAHCYYSCYSPHRINIEVTSSTEFNVEFCNQYGFHRVGDFCRRCNDSYGLAAYSYQLIRCVPCEDYGYKNWFKYFAVALLPLTVFYILAVLLSFNVTSSSFNGVVLVAQCIISPQQLEYLNIADLNNDFTPLSSSGTLATKISITMFSIGNLDFFRLIYTPFCLHPNVNVLEMLTLEYIIALYPFLLLLITYFLVHAYDREYRLLLYIWKPFKICFNHYHKTWNVRASLIQVFATFILLTYVKILGVSLEILYLSLSKTSIQNVTGERVLDGFFTIYDVKIQYFGAKHLPFAVIATTISFIFVLLPLLLLALYPCGCFQRCLNHCGGRCQPLHVFMDVFQGYYRTHPRDLRYFSAFYLLLRILLLLQWYTFFSGRMLYTSGMLSLAGAGMVAVFQPYKVKAHNTIDTVLMMLMGVYFISFRENAGSYDAAFITYSKFFEGLALILITMYFILRLAWKLRLHLKMKALVKKAKRVWKSTIAEDIRGEEEVIESFARDHDTTPTQSYQSLISQPELSTY